MPTTKRPKPLYTRGKYRLDRRADRGPLVISWYDEARRRERGVSAGTSDVGAGKQALDRMYLQDGGATVCSECGQLVHGAESPLVCDAIADYITMRADRAGAEAINARLDHVVKYLEHLGAMTLRCSSIDEEWITRFRTWLQARPVMSSLGREVRARAVSTTENSVLQLAAAVNFADKRGAKFRPAPPKDVNRTPQYRADVAMLVRMFEYATVPKKKRETLLAYLRLAVLTLGRPDAVLGASVDPKAGQWDRQHNLFNLSPKGRKQTTKYRATVPIAKQAVAWLNEMQDDFIRRTKNREIIVGEIVKANTIKTSWNGMAAELELPGEGESGSKLIRRSMADILRRRMAVDGWPEIEIFLGHDRFDSVSGLYAPLRPDYLVKALTVIEKVVAEIETKVPGAFYRAFTAPLFSETETRVA